MPSHKRRYIQGASLTSIVLVAVSLAAQADSAKVTYAPSMKHPLVPSHGSALFGVFYLAGGSGLHPTAILFNGFPGYEQNLDLAQALRHSGWNVLAMHYRGSWGVSGGFSFINATEDADEEVKFVLDPNNCAVYHIDSSRIVVIGHSMGGMMAVSAAAHDRRIKAVVLISAWNVGANRSDEAGEAKALASNDNLAPISGTDGARLAHEEFTHRSELDMNQLAAAVAPRPALIVTANDGSEQFADPFVAALTSAGDLHVQSRHFDTDHPYSSKRIELSAAVLDFLNSL